MQCTPIGVAAETTGKKVVSQCFSFLPSLLADVVDLLLLRGLSQCSRCRAAPTASRAAVDRGNAAALGPEELAVLAVRGEDPAVVTWQGSTAPRSAPCASCGNRTAKGREAGYYN